jgi:hypothetical protein
MFRMFLGLIILGFTAGATASNTEIPMVGLDSEGNPVEFTMEKGTYIKNLSDGIRATEAATLNALEKRPSSTSKWTLRTIVVGMGVNLEAGLSKVFKLSAMPKFRVLFSKDKDPVTP